MKRIATLACLTLAAAMISCDKPRISSEGATMVAPNSTTSSNGQPTDYLLEYSTVGLQPLGDGLHKITTVLRLQRDENTAFLESHRSQSDKPGEPIGIFQATLPSAEFDRFLDLVNKAKLESLTPSGGRGLGDSLLTLTFKQNDQTVTRSFGSRDVATVQKMGKLLPELTQLTGKLRGHPICALQASVTYEAQPKPHFLLTLTNIGSESITINDPRLFKGTDEDLWAGVEVAELQIERPGITSPTQQWTRVPVVHKDGRTTAVILKPGETLTVPTVFWQGQRKGLKYVASGVFSDYTGPDKVGDIQRIRGATFSKNLEFEVK